MSVNLAEVQHLAQWYYWVQWLEILIIISRFDIFCIKHIKALSPQSISSYKTWPGMHNSLFLEDISSYQWLVTILWYLVITKVSEQLPTYYQRQNIDTVWPICFVKTGFNQTQTQLYLVWKLWHLLLNISLNLLEEQAGLSRTTLEISSGFSCEFPLWKWSLSFYGKFRYYLFITFDWYNQLFKI